MPDNSPQQGTDTIATDEVATLNGAASTGVKVQRVKVGYGVDGDFTDVSATAPMWVRDRQDANRQPVSLIIDALTGVATEALVSYGGFNNGATLTAGTGAFIVPAGRIFRVQRMSLAVTGTAIATMRARLRAAATVTATSPHYLACAGAHAANSGANDNAMPHDAVEIGPGLQVGISIIGATSQTYSVTVQGFTYVP